MTRSLSKALTDYDIKLGETKQNGDLWTFIDIIDIFKKVCKHWTFCLEENKKTYDRHYQCSIRLQKRTIKSNLSKLLKCELVDAQITILPCIKGKHTTSNFNYDCCMTESHTIVGNWNSRDNNDISSLYADINPIYQFIFESLQRQKAEDPNFRIINILLDKNNDVDKKIFAKLCEIYGIGIYLQHSKSTEKLMQTMCCHCSGQNICDPKLVLIELPHTMNRVKTCEIFDVIKYIKDGCIWDTRHHYKNWWIDSPVIWIFTRTFPNLELFSKDQWVYWEINDEKELKRVNIDDYKEHNNKKFEPDEILELEL